MTLTISCSDVYDMMQAGGSPMFAALRGKALGVVQGGGQIFIQQEYSNAAPDLVDVLTTEQDLGKWFPA